MLPIVEDDLTGCWFWKAVARRDGYCPVTYQGKKWYAHRLVYTLQVGPIPDDLELDHLCKTRQCVNPEHLELVTHEENMRRSEANNRAKTHCPKGHPYDEKNTYRYNGKRNCKICQRDRAKEQRRGF